MSPFLAVAADLLVACLLVVAIATSIRLSRRIAAMKADEAALRATVTELVLATEKADAAIGALRATVLESERTLSDRLGAAARHTERLAKEVMAGEAVIERVSKIADISRRLRGEEGAPGARAPVPVPASPEMPAFDPRAPLREDDARDDGLRAAIRLARDAASRRVGGRAA